MMKRYILIVLFSGLFIPFLTLAQSGTSLLPDYRYGISGNFGANRLFGDLKANTPTGFSGSVRLSMMVMHGLELGIAGQTGLLKADNEAATLADLKFAKNHYVLGTVDARVYPAQFFRNDYDRRVEYRASFGEKILNRAYLGVGYGIMSNKQLDVETRGNVDISHVSEHSSGITYVGSFNTGVNIPLSSLRPWDLDMTIWSLNFNAQYNVGMGGTPKNSDIMDGWVLNNNPDAFIYYSVGIHIAF